MPLITLASDRVAGPSVIADLYECFAVHNDPDNWQVFNLTHVPTGRAVIWGVTHGSAIAAAEELLAGELDWGRVAKVADLTPAHKAQGNALRKKYMGG